LVDKNLSLGAFVKSKKHTFYTLFILFLSTSATHGGLITLFKKRWNERLERFINKPSLYQRFKQKMQQEVREEFEYRKERLHLRWDDFTYKFTPLKERYAAGKQWTLNKMPIPKRKKYRRKTHEKK